MSLAEEARGRTRRPGPKCSIAAALLQLGVELDEALKDWSIPAVALEEALADRGWEISEYTIRRHRNGRCRC